MRLPLLFFASLLYLLHPAGALADGNITVAPDFRLPAIANADDTIELNSYLGKVTYLDFWASWCGPCRLSLPALDALYKELRSDTKRRLARL